ncbi:Pentatricopeptide repeat-containing [Hyphodiscus hymeniophilus]|uniref:Pentatricopeptide repeat-containing n=1 Tax=Hyphodiscus hymeniophilus TaxID=353542 RepID=A0A9P6VQV7_9HELO|nr:Pentatricopeptide repeat-containing [Hyphodiscus hymeniophilus]
MNSSYICLACRRSLSRKRPHKAIQWRPRATFISLSDNASKSTDGRSREGILQLGNVENEKKRRYVSLGSTQEGKKPPRQPSPHIDGDLLEALFEESLKDPSPDAAKPSQSISLVEPYIHANTLRTMLADKDGSVVDAWKVFVGHFGPEAWRNGSIDQRTVPRYLHLSRNLLTKKYLEAKRRDPFSLDLPTVTEFSKVYSQLGELRSGNWCEAMLILLENLIKLDHSSPDGLVRRDRLISDVVGAWNVVFRQVGKAQDFPPEGSPLDWSHIPHISIRESSAVYRNFGTRSIFAQFAPGFPLRTQSNMAVVAVATFTLLTQESIAGEAVMIEASPLISSLSAAIAVNGLDFGTLADMGTVSPSVDQLLNETASKTKDIALKMQAKLIGDEAVPSSISESRPSPKLKSPSNRSLSSSLRTDVASITKRLYDALQRGDAPQVDNLWSGVKLYPVADEQNNANVAGPTEHSNTSNRGKLNADLCNYFILVYMALRNPNGAIQVWNHMVKSGLIPTRKTWDSMMNGCKACRDHKALEDIWMRMHQFGVEPDVVCWTTRISGLFECNKLDKGMHALDEMGRLWIAANNKEPEHPPKQRKGSKQKTIAMEHVRPAVKPTIETVNAAVSGLLRRHQTEAARRVLSWAVGFDIKPDVITYNILLTPLIRDGNSKQAMLLLKQMQKEGIEADVATFTAILDETFRYSSELSPTEQTVIINNVFSEMEAAGVEANVQTYGKMVHQLLQSANEDLRAVNAVMEQMTTRGIQPSPYIYTMLVTYYFDREPADLDAVRNLIENAKVEVGSVDHVFWDRVIEGYARNGETTAAMRILGELERKGGRVSWVAKQVLLRSLVQNDQWDIAKTFVRDVKHDTGGPKPAHEMRGNEGQHHFWRLAAELELL